MQTQPQRPIRSNLCMALSACTIEQEPKIQLKFSKPFPSSRVGSGNVTTVRVPHFATIFNKLMCHQLLYTQKVSPGHFAITNSLSLMHICKTNVKSTLVNVNRCNIQKQTKASIILFMYSVHVHVQVKLWSEGLHTYAVFRLYSIILLCTVQLHVLYIHYTYIHEHQPEQDSYYMYIHVVIISVNHAHMQCTCTVVSRANTQSRVSAHVGQNRESC